MAVRLPGAERGARLPLGLTFEPSPLFFSLSLSQSFSHTRTHSHARSHRATAPSDQLETGADNLVLSECPSQYSPECWSESQAFTLSSPDVMVWLIREYKAYAAFLTAWGEQGWGAGWEVEAAGALRYAARLRDVIHERLWLWLDPPANTRGLYVGFNVSTGRQSVHRTYQAAWPVWEGLAANESVRSAALTTLMEADLWGGWGVRSVSTGDPRFNNDNIINPYSNWRGPIWINVNAIISYTLRANGLEAAAAALADTVVHTLAEDLRNSGTWHECFNSENGTGLAASGFLSWDTLGADLQADVAAGRDPFKI